MNINPFEKSYTAAQARKIVRLLFCMPEGSTIKIDESDKINHRSIRSQLQSVCNAAGMTINTKRCEEGFLWIKRNTCALDRLKTLIIELFEWQGPSLHSYSKLEIAKTMKVNYENPTEMMLLDETIKMVDGKITDLQYMNLPRLITDEH